MGSCFRRNEGIDGKGFGLHSEIKIPAFAGMTEGNTPSP